MDISMAMVRNFCEEMGVKNRGCKSDKLECCKTASFQKLLVVRRCVRERIIEATAIPLRGVHKSVEIFLDIDRLEEQALVTILLGVFDQNSCGAIDAPDPKSRPKKSAIRKKFFRTRHRMEAIDCG